MVTVNGHAIDVGALGLLSRARDASTSGGFELRAVLGEPGMVERDVGGAVEPGIFSLAPKGSGKLESDNPYLDSWPFHLGVKTKADKIAGVRLVLWDSDDPETAKPVSSEHPLARLLARPNHDMSWAEFARAGYVNRATTGEDIWFLADEVGQPIVKPPAGFNGRNAYPQPPIPYPAQIIGVGGLAVTDMRDSLGVIRSWRYAGATGTPPLFPRGSVLHIADYDPRDPQRGMGAAEVAARLITTGFQAERQQDAVMRGGGYGAYLIRKNGAIDPVEHQRQQQELTAKERDPSNVRRTKFLNGDYEVIPNPATAQDLGVFEQLRWTRDSTLSILGVPLPCAGIYEDATYANKAAADRQLMLSVIDYLSTVADAINTKLIPFLQDVPAQKFRVAFAANEIEELKTDNTDRFKAAAEIAAKGVGASYDSARADLGLDFKPTTGTDTALVPATVVPMSEVLPDPTRDDAIAADKAVQDSALNGSQVTGMLEILTALSEGKLTTEGAIAVLQVAFPTIDEAEARRIVEGVNETEPPTPPEAPKTPKEKPKAVDETERALFTKIEPLEESARREFVKSYEQRVLRRGDRKVYRHVKRWFVNLEKAYLARIKRIAGSASKAMPIVERISSDEFNAMLLEREDKWSKLLAEYAGPSIDDVFEMGLRDAADEHGGISIPMTDPRVQRALERQKIDMSEGVTSTITNRVRKALLDVLGEPATINDLQAAVKAQLPELTDAMKRVFGTKDARALTIARTESGHASSAARYMQYGEEGVTKLQWITAHDDAVREAHKDLDGDVVSYGSEFAKGLRYPRDEEGEAGQVINCRCTFLGMTPDDQ